MVVKNAKHRREKSVCIGYNRSVRFSRFTTTRPGSISLRPIAGCSDSLRGHAAPVVIAMFRYRFRKGASAYLDPNAKGLCCMLMRKHPKKTSKTVSVHPGAANLDLRTGTVLAHDTSSDHPAQQLDAMARNQRKDRRYS